MYIVTGGAGFIGSAMIWRLNEAGIDDILVVDNLASSEKWRNLVNRRYRDYVHRDEFRRMVLEGRAPQKVEAIIHMGACSSTTERNADFLMDNNLHYSQMVCRYALEQGARLINASSAATYGDGCSPVSVVFPCAIAARKRARLEIDLLPGSRTVPEAALTGSIVMLSGRRKTSQDCVMTTFYFRLGGKWGAMRRRASAARAKIARVTSISSFSTAWRSSARSFSK